MSLFATRVNCVKGDITALARDYDVIVNAANSQLIPGGGVDGAIHHAAGPELAKECAVIGKCQTGSAVITRSYNLPCKAIIHTVGPVYRLRRFGDYDKDLFEEPSERLEEESSYTEPNPNADEQLRSCYESSLCLAAENNFHSIAFPCISTGVYGFPPERAAAIAVRTVNDYIKAHGYTFDKIAFVTFDEKNYTLYKELVCGRDMMLQHLMNIEKDIDNNFDMLRGEFNRMSLTKDEKELRQMRQSAKHTLERMGEVFDEMFKLKEATILMTTPAPLPEKTLIDWSKLRKDCGISASANTASLEKKKPLLKKPFNTNGPDR